MDSAFKTWIGQPVVLQVALGDIKVPLRGKLLKDGPETVRMRIGEGWDVRSEEHTSELQSPCNLVCRLLLEKKKINIQSRLPERGRLDILIHPSMLRAAPFVKFCIE